ncbi:hypothetical protein [uncultured Desulfobacter sp.]|uniref:hypothetical protein n=1 Tax=uncultured Desulfobacter sp. TaxID=240139 RepID=UPI002AABBE8A|nr:hypothetical protein [uncultured Desulfobacter sp.]
MSDSAFACMSPKTNRFREYMVQSLPITIPRLIVSGRLNSTTSTLGSITVLFPILSISSITEPLSIKIFPLGVQKYIIFIAFARQKLYVTRGFFLGIMVDWGFRNTVNHNSFGSGKVYAAPAAFFVFECHQLVGFV